MEPGLMSEITKSSKFSLRVGFLTSCFKPFAEQNFSSEVPSTETPEDENFNQREWCTLQSPISTVPTNSEDRRRHSTSQLFIDAVSPLQGGLYQMPSRIGPMSEWTVCHDRSEESLCSCKTTCPEKSLDTKQAIPPPDCSSPRSLRETSL